MSPLARWRVISSTACLCFGITASTTAGAESWLSASGSPRCPVSPEALAARVASAVAGDVDPELRVAVEVRDSERATTATVSLSQGTRRLGQRRLVAADCDEALGAVVAVTALALSSTQDPGTESAAREDDLQEQGVRTAAVASPEQQHADPAPPALEPAALVDRGSSSEAAARAPAASLLLGTGADVSGGSSSVLLSVGAALRSEGGAWRVQLWYGLPSFLNEEDALQGSLKTRTERGAALVDYCRNVDAAGWFAVCGGLELGLGHRWQAEAVGGQARLERRWLEPWLGAVFGTRLTYRHARWQPAMELSTVLPVVDAADSRRVGLRAQAGVAVPF